MNGTASKRSRVTHLNLQNWRNFLRVEIDLPRRVFLVGPNAAGKSNLLDVFRFFHDIVAVGGGLQEAIRRRGGVSRIRCLAARRNPEVVVRMQVGNDIDPSAWDYELRFAQDNRQRPLIRAERVFKSGTLILERPDQSDKKDQERLTQTYLEQVNANQDFRGIGDFFATVRYLHIIPQLVREPDRSVGKRNDPFGGDFLEQIARTPPKTQKSRLKRIEEALRFAVPQLKQLGLERDARGTPHLRGKYEHWRPQGAWQGEEQFSDGTLRLMGLLWATLDGSGPMLLEEPELSLHPGVVRYIPQMFARIQRRSGRQILVSTHSPDLLSDEGLGLDEVFLLRPGPEGTEVSPASDMQEVKDLLESGLSMAEVVLPKTQPQQARQLMLFGEQ